MRVPVVIACLALSVTASARAQESLSIGAARRDTISASATVTAAFAIANRRDNAVTLTPRVEIPPGWTVLMGEASLSLAPRAADMLMVSVAVPARTAAGVYPIRVRIADSSSLGTVLDSVMVTVMPRRKLDLGVVDRPGYVIAGQEYEAGFLVRNRGNLPSRIRLTAHTSAGIAVYGDTVLQLDADAARVVRFRVQTRLALEAASDDVLEVFATHASDSATTASASARVTMVPEPSRTIEEFVRVPTTVRLRAATSNGVSPFEIVGSGHLRDRGDTRIDFLFRGPTGRFSAFGERDEYRVDVTSTSWGARFGDHFYALTPLTGGLQPGFGAGADAKLGGISFGGHGQRFRRALDKGNEIAAYVAADPVPAGRVALNLVNRVGGSLAGGVGSATASYGFGAYRAGAEIARSNSTDGSGTAHAARFSAAGSGYSFDFGHQFADPVFAGALRGSAHDYFTASARPFDLVSFAANGGSHRTDLSRSILSPYEERLDAGILAATFVDRITVELGGVSRTTTTQTGRAVGTQRGVRTRVMQPTRFAQLSLEGEAGRARDDTAAARTFTHFSIGARRQLERGSIGLWTERYSGGSVTQGQDGSMSLGGDASLRVARNTDLTLSGFATRLDIPGAELHSQLDALVTHTLRNGSTISLRTRLMRGGAYRSDEQSVAYLEYGIPLRLPVSRLRTPGRVYGRVVDETTGQGVAGALVRLGPQVAITDKTGQVAFGGVPGGEHRLSMSQETSFADAVFVGDPTLTVDSNRAEPTTFRLAIARSARIDIDVRRFVVAQTGIEGKPDSLSDAGPLENASLILVGARDTLYRSTNQGGKVSFTDIPPGDWELVVRGDAPAFHRFEPDRMSVHLGPGETRDVAFRLVPRRREVQLIGNGQELRPTTAGPKTVIQAGTRVVQPPNQKDDR